LRTNADSDEISSFSQTSIYY